MASNDKVCMDYTYCETYLKEDKEYDGNMHSQCALECGESDYMMPTIIDAKYNVIQYLCKDACTGDYPYVKAEDDRTCVKVCASGFFKQVGSTKVCIDVCNTSVTEIQLATEDLDNNEMRQCTYNCKDSAFEDAWTEDGKQYRQCVAYSDRRYFDKVTIWVYSTAISFFHYYAETCPENLPFIGATSNEFGKACVASCSSGVFKVDPANGDKVCASKDACEYDIRVVDDATQECVLACDASEYWVDREDGTKYCYPTVCPADHPYIATVDSKECIEECADGYYTESNGVKVCSKKCDHYTQFARIAGADGMKQCASDCGESIYYRDRPAEFIRQCVTEDSDYYRLVNVTVGEELVEYHEYLDPNKCVSPAPSHDKDSKECKPDCGDKPYIPSTETGNVCLAKCKDEGMYNEGGVCHEKCKSHPYYQVEDGENVCVDVCEGDYPYRDNDQCVSSCASGFFKVVEDGVKVCVDVCEASEFAELPEAEGKPRQCVADCKQRFFEDPAQS